VIQYIVLGFEQALRDAHVQAVPQFMLLADYLLLLGGLLAMGLLALVRCGVVVVKALLRARR
jgi:hypothetical protein